MYGWYRVARVTQNDYIGLLLRTRSSNSETQQERPMNRRQEEFREAELAVLRLKEQTAMQDTSK